MKIQQRKISCGERVGSFLSGGIFIRGSGGLPAWTWLPEENDCEVIIGSCAGKHMAWAWGHKASDPDKAPVNQAGVRAPHALRAARCDMSLLPPPQHQPSAEIISQGMLPQLTLSSQQRKSGASHGSEFANQFFWAPARRRLLVTKPWRKAWTVVDKLI